MSRYFTIDDLKKSKVGNINSHLFSGKLKNGKPDLLKKTEQKVKKLSKSKMYIDAELVTFCDGKPLTLYREFQFYPGRKYRFDWAILELKIAIEYEGIYGSGKSGHTTQPGYNKDTFKYNLAADSGWKVYRYTARTFKNLTVDLKVIK
jgi:hypothetical protein